MDEQLAAARIVWLSSVRPDGSSHTVPVWFVHDVSGSWAASSPSRHKIANMT